MKQKQECVESRWPLVRLKHVARVRFSNVDKNSVTGERPIRLCNYVDVYYHDTIDDSIDFMETTATEEEVARFGIRADDVMITKDSESWNDIAVPAVARDVPADLICGYHLAHIRPDGRQLNGRYLARALSATGIRDQFRMAANGITRYGLTQDAITGARIPLPPVSVQVAIADFLDRETAKIDALIERERRLIQRLTEYRTALIAGAVSGQVEISQTTAGAHRAGREAERASRRGALGAAVYERIGRSKGFGRVKLQKAVVVAERHLRLSGIDSQITRERFGPHDPALLRDIHRSMAESGRCIPERVLPPGRGFVYTPGPTDGTPVEDFGRFWSAQQQEFDGLMNLFGGLTKRQAEVVATLYIAWNDFRLLGRQPADLELIADVRTNWHPRKGTIDIPVWQKWLDWMRSHGIVPTGYGSLSALRPPHTVKGQQKDLEHG